MAREERTVNGKTSTDVRFFLTSLDNIELVCLLFLVIKLYKIQFNDLVFLFIHGLCLHVLTVEN